MRPGVDASRLRSLGGDSWHDHSVAMTTPLEALTGGMAVDIFVDTFVVDASPLVFRDRHAYHAWRRSLAPLLDVDPAALHIVGSAVVGFSMAPGSGLAALRPDSDVDVAVISAYHFDLAWRALRAMTGGSFKLPARYRYSIRQHAPRDVFSGCIATDIILPVLPFRQQWMAARTRPEVVDPIGSRDINFRLYRDLDGLRAYQLRS